MLFIFLSKSFENTIYGVYEVYHIVTSLFAIYKYNNLSYVSVINYEKLKLAHSFNVSKKIYGSSITLLPYEHIIFVTPLLCIAYNRYWFTSVLVIRFFVFPNIDGRVAITFAPFGQDCFEYSVPTSRPILSRNQIKTVEKQSFFFTESL